MSESRPKQAATSSPRQCEGFLCFATDDVRYDHTSHLWLCLQCWAKVDPAKFPPPDRRIAR